MRTGAAPVTAVRPPLWQRCRSVIALLLFAACFVGESVYSYRQKSATLEEPMHLAQGYYALALHDYRFDISRPPLLGLWAALPLRSLTVVADAEVIDEKTPEVWAFIASADEAHRFLYSANDADALLYRARLMTVLLGVLLGLLVFAWVHEWLGFGPAVAGLVMVALEPNLIAHFSLVTSDAGVAVFAFGALYGLWRLCLRATLLNALPLCLFTALAVTSSYWSLLLVPVVAVLLALAVFPLRRLSAVTAVATLGLVLAVSYSAVWASYRFQYAPARGAAWVYTFHDNPYTIEQAPRQAALVRWIDDRRLLPNAYSEGWLLAQTEIERRSAFLGGQYSDAGWWYYFPITLLLKTPVALIILVGWAFLRLFRRRREEWTTAVFLGVPFVTFFGAAMLWAANNGVRHVLVVYPLIILFSTLPIQQLLDVARGRGRAFVALLAVVWVFEFALAYPSPLAFFNLLSGGPTTGDRYLTDSNIDWGQDLKGLSAWMSERGIAALNLAYYGAAAPGYYGMRVTYLAGSPSFVPPDQIDLPKLPGYVAISRTLLSGVFVDEPRRASYRPLQQMAPVAVIGNSMNVYWVERPWW